MTALSPETRRMLLLSRAADDPSPSREQAVRDRLIAELGVAALAGMAATSAAVGAAEGAGGASAGALSGSASSSVAAGSAVAQTTSATTAALAKTLAGWVLVASLGLSATNGDIAQHLGAWPAVAMQMKSVAKQAWQRVAPSADGDAVSSRGAPATPRVPPLDPDSRRHELLIGIARGPHHPVAKEAELILILQAEQALAAGDVERATHYLDEHEARFVGGALTDNREALRALVARSPVAPPRAEAHGEVETNF